MRLYKLAKPENETEAKLVYKITNFNSETQKCYIEPINSKLAIPNNELVSINDLKEIENDN